MSVSLIVESHGAGAAINRLSRIAGWSKDEAAVSVAALLESQTRRRIEEEKTAPDGTAWPRNREGTSILLRTGRNLRDSIAGRAQGGDAVVEAHWAHAHVHQTGMVIRPKNAKRLVFTSGGEVRFARKVTIPKREFIGLSADNENEIVEELEAMLADLARGVR